MAKHNLIATGQTDDNDGHDGPQFDRHDGALKLVAGAESDACESIEESCGHWRLSQRAGGRGPLVPQDFP